MHNDNEGRYEVTSVWLRRSNEKTRMFFCTTCRYGLLRYKGSVASIIPGNAEGFEASQIPENYTKTIKMPIEIRCGGSSAKYGRCPAVYIFEGIVDE
jgi:hypothetical protein